MTDIPDWIDEKLDIKPRADIQDRAIVEYFLESDEPYHSRKQIQTEFGWSKQNANDRLRNLVELRVLESDSIADGKIYWINREKSSWPIPPDVDVVGPPEERSIVDSLDRSMKWIGVVGVLSTLFGGLTVTIAPFLAVFGIFETLGVDNGVGIFLVIGWIALTLGFVALIPPSVDLLWEYRDQM